MGLTDGLPVRARATLPHTRRPMTKMSTGFGPGGITRETQATGRPGVYSVSMAVLLHWQQERTPATVRAVAKRVGLRSSETAHKWLERAVAAGLIDKRGTHYVPLSDCKCPTCGAAHPAERQSA